MEKIKQIENLKVFVIGDCFIDHYIYGSTTRISPEAPIPVVEKLSDSFTLGGAGNVVKNLVALGCRNLTFSYRSNLKKLCPSSVQIYNLLKKYKVKNIITVEDPNCITGIKTRVVVGHHQVCRIDYENIYDLSNSLSDLILKSIEEIKPHIIILSDYNKGFITDYLIENLPLNIKVFVDSKKKDLSVFQNKYCLKINSTEAELFFGKKITNFEEVCKVLLDKTNSTEVIITRGKDGFSYLSKNSKYYENKINTKEVFDVTGAGDTFLSIYSLLSSTGTEVFQSLNYANLGCSIVVGKLGSSTCSLSELFNYQTKENK